MGNVIIFRRPDLIRTKNSTRHGNAESLLKGYFPLALAPAPAVRAREPSVPLLQAILKEKTTCGQTSQGSP